MTTKYRNTVAWEIPAEYETDAPTLRPSPPSGWPHNSGSLLDDHFHSFEMAATSRAADYKQPLNRSRIMSRRTAASLDIGSGSKRYNVVFMFWDIEFNPKSKTQYLKLSAEDFYQPMYKLKSSFARLIGSQFYFRVDEPSIQFYSVRALASRIA